MGARISIDASGYIEHRERPRDRVGVDGTVARRERDFEGVALGVGLGGVLWLILASIARLIA